MKMGLFRKNVLQETDAEVNARHAAIGKYLIQVGLKAQREFKKNKNKKK